MYSNQTKVYYTTLPTTNGGGGTGGSGGINGDNPFVTESLVLLDLYNKGNVQGFYNELPTFQQLKVTNPDYKLNNTSSSVTQLVDIMNSLLIVKKDLEDQIYILENNNFCISHDNNLNIASVQMTQHSGLKLEYLQYLLLYDIKLTNGIFIDTYLTESRKVLEQNGGILYHPQ